MSIDRLGKELEALGVSGNDVRCLLLLPQVYVGWASKRRDVGALEALLDNTARRARCDRASTNTARSWLFDAPTRAQFQSGFALLRMLCKTPQQALIRSSDVLQSMLWASSAAQLDREPSSGGRGRVTAAAHNAMLELEAWLEVDVGAVWTRALDQPEEAARGNRQEISAAQSFQARPEERGPFEGRRSSTQLRVGPRLPTEAPAPASVPFPLVRRRA
jgi:hypothetical protein